MAYYIAEGAVVKGQVTMADGASVWMGMKSIGPGR